MSKPLLTANIALLAAIGIHGADHFTQARGVDALATEVIVGGQVVLLLAVLSLALTLRRHAWAPAVALAVGLSVASGVISSHFAPHWSAFSDPYADLDLPALSWAAAGVEVVAAIVLAGVAFTRLRARPAVATG
jgi:hypothetical protein